MDLVHSVGWSPDGEKIVSGSGDFTSRVWDAGTGEEQLVLKGHADQVTSVRWSSDGKRIVSGSGDGTLKVWDAGTGEELFTSVDAIPQSCGEVRDVKFSLDGQRIAAACENGAVHIFSPNQQSLDFPGRPLRRSKSTGRSESTA